MAEPPEEHWPPWLSDRLIGGQRRSWFYDRQGQPMTSAQYEATFTEENYERARRVGKDVLVVGDDPISVSTVWLGMDMGFGFSGLPIIFETMIFGGPYDSECTRYATELAAQEGHARTVADLAADRTPWFLTDHMDTAEEQ